MPDDSTRTVLVALYRADIVPMGKARAEIPT
jgi:hypothetical protein